VNRSIEGDSRKKRGGRESTNGGRKKGGKIEQHYLAGKGCLGNQKAVRKTRKRRKKRK